MLELRISLFHDGKRYRCRSAHYDRVHAWLDDMKQKFNNPAYTPATEQINKARPSSCFAHDTPQKFKTGCATLMSGLLIITTI